MAEQDCNDQEILNFEKQIKSLDKSPLVGEMLDFSALKAEFEGGNTVCKQKIEYLINSAKGIRCVKKDGNCFYRAFAYRFTELLKQESSWKRTMLANVVKTKDILKEMGYEVDLMEDFYGPFENAILKDEVSLLETFTTQHLSDTIVCYLRILTAAILRKV
jgi:ubiquitin thioesterase protein OTUB1